MTFRTVKGDTSDTYKQRVENAIEKLAGVELWAADTIMYKFTREELLEFDIDDMQQKSGRTSQVFTDGTFVILPDEKILMV